jgi:hypothetical protein
MDKIISDGYEKGLRAREIAAILKKQTGKDVSKNAVIGRANRIGLQSSSYAHALTKS